MREKPTFPEPTPGVPRLSHSRAEDYIGCGVRYLFKQDKDIRRRTTIPLAIGGAVDEASRVDNLSKLDGEPLKTTEIIEVGVMEYEDTFRVNEADAKALEIQRGKDETAAATREYALNVSPQTPEPKLIQAPIVADLGGLELAGVPDYCEKVSDELVPIDLKVGRERTAPEARRSRQLTSYGLLVRARSGKLPSRVAFDSVFRVKNEWKSRRLWAERTAGDYLAHIKFLKTVQHGINAGVFLPAAEGDWRCSAKWCEFHTICEHAQGRK